MQQKSALRNSTSMRRDGLEAASTTDGCKAMPQRYNCQEWHRAVFHSDRTLAPPAHRQSKHGSTDSEKKFRRFGVLTTSDAWVAGALHQQQLCLQQEVGLPGQHHCPSHKPETHPQCCACLRLCLSADSICSPCASPCCFVPSSVSAPVHVFVGARDGHGAAAKVNFAGQQRHGAAADQQRAETRWIAEDLVVRQHLQHTAA